MEEHSSLLISLVPVLALFVVGIIALAAFVFWIWMLVHAITNKGLTDTEKLVWVVVIIFLHFLGGLIYFFIGRPKQNIIHA